MTLLTLQSFTAHDGNFITATPGAGRMPSTSEEILSNPSHIDGAGPLHSAGWEQGRTQQTVHRGTQSRGRVTETSWDRKSGRKKG